MPNGNILMIVWERKTPQEAIAAGVKTELAGKTKMLVDALIEVRPASLTGGQIVWEWHLWDHLIQYQDRSKANYGSTSLALVRHHGDCQSLQRWVHDLQSVIQGQDHSDTVPFKMCPQGTKPARWSVCRLATFFGLHRAAGTLP